MSASHSQDQMDTTASLLYIDLFLLHLPLFRICCQRLLPELEDLIQTRAEAPYASQCYELISLCPRGPCSLFSSRILYTAKHLLRGFCIKEAYMVHFINT